MDIRQGLSDITLRLKEDRKTQVIAILAVLAAVFLMTSSGQSGRMQVRAQPQLATSTGTIQESGNNDFNDLLTANKNQIEELAAQNAKMNAELVESRRDLSETKDAMVKISKNMLARMSELENAVAANNGNNNNGAMNAQPEEEIQFANDDLQSFGELDEGGEVAPPQEPKQERLAVIGVGDAVRVKLLSGVNAPTDGTPYPVVLELIDDITGPDGSSLSVGNARLVAAAQGSLTDSRALFRLSTLNIRMPDGARQIVDVDGWIVGEDGTIGMEGILIDPIGKILAGEVMSGTIEGAGRGLANGGTQVYANTGITAIKNGELWKSALGEGVGDAADKWSDILEERFNKMVPHVRVLSGRTATAVFSKNQTIPGLYDALNEEEETFVALD